MWIEHCNGKRYPVDAPPFHRAAAFCGLGNHESFRRTLEQMGVQPADWVEFDDHHRYRPRELQRISVQAQAKGADAVITTQKDAVNLCEDVDDLTSPLPLYWLDVMLAVEREADFLCELDRRLGWNGNRR